MDRRDFLKFAALTAAGIFFHDKVYAADDDSWKLYDPPIEKPFLRFTEYEARPKTEVIVIHHTGFPDGDKDSTVEEIHKFHQEVNGWAGCGYHFLIRKNGMIEQGRKLPAVGAHALHHNKNSVGICLAGNFELAKPKLAQMESLKILTSWLCQKYKLNPMAQGVIVGHRDLNDTACPGENLYRKLGSVRRYCRDHSIDNEQ